MAEVQEGDILAGKYRVERILGEGGMGFVVAATHITLEERVALKFMRADVMSSPESVERFLREARAAVKLKSEHVAHVRDVGTLESGSPYIVMEYLEGEDFAQLLARRGPLPIAEAADYLIQACDAIAEAHNRGIIHRDLKPANLFVTSARDGAPLLKVLDFGISKLNALGDAPDSMTSSRAILGSPLYMSPEQMKSSRDVGVGTDIWSLGVILYEALAGHVPFDEPTMGALMARVLTEAPPPLTVRNEFAPPALTTVVMSCLEKDPARRYGSAVDFARALAPFAPEAAAERVSRIVSMSNPLTSSMSGSHSTIPATLVSPSGRVAHPSILGVAATQTAGDGDQASGQRKRRGALLATVGVVVASAAVVIFLATRSGSAPAVPVSPAAPPPLSASTPSAATATPAPTVPAPTSTAAAAAAEPSSSASLPAASSPTASTKPVTPPGRTSSPRPPASSRHAGAPPSDPFGTNRQ
jgi:eukaryotic-like serine/threonine-protein kinase